MKPNLTVSSDGTKVWYLSGKIHREDGPAIEYPNGGKAWYLNGQLHREDGPAIVWPNGHKEWCFKGILHRLDGPAVEYASGAKAWWVNGNPLSKEEWLNSLSAEDKENILFDSNFIISK